VAKTPKARSTVMREALDRVHANRGVKEGTPAALAQQIDLALVDLYAFRNVDAEYALEKLSATLRGTD